MLGREELERVEKAKANTLLHQRVFTSGVAVTKLVLGTGNEAGNMMLKRQTEQPVTQSSGAIGTGFRRKSFRQQHGAFAGG